MKAPVMYEFLRGEGGEGGVDEGRFAAAEVRGGSKSYSTAMDVKLSYVSY